MFRIFVNIILLLCREYLAALTTMVLIIVIVTYLLSLFYLHKHTGNIIIITNIKWIIILKLTYGYWFVNYIITYSINI